MKLIRILSLAASILLATFPAQGKGKLGFDGEDATSVGIYIKDLTTGKVVMEHNSSLALTPASVMKAITTASVVTKAGIDTCFTTTVGLSGQATEDGWHGNIIVHASGDPTLESSNFKSYQGFCDSIAAALRRRGIQDIDGDIIVKTDMPDEGPVMQWECEDIAWPYGAGFFGFNWRDNTTTLTPATGTTSPHVPGLEVCVVPSDSNDLVRGAFSDRLTVYTKGPVKPDRKTDTTVPDPAAVFKYELLHLLDRKGISLSGDVADASEEEIIHVHRSAPFGEIMKSLMVRSDNLFAEGMLRTLAPGQSRSRAIKKEKEIWANHGFKPKYTIIHDGSGLTRANRLSPRFIGNVLEWMSKSKQAGAYTSFFPRAGSDGTMRGFLAKSKTLKGRIALKTGSVSSVQCYAGYKLSSKGKPTHVIVIMVNGFFCPRAQVRKSCEDLLTRLFP